MAVHVACAIIMHSSYREFSIDCSTVYDMLLKQISVYNNTDCGTTEKCGYAVSVAIASLLTGWAVCYKFESSPFLAVGGYWERDRCNAHHSSPPLRGHAQHGVR